MTNNQRCHNVLTIEKYDCRTYVGHLTKNGVYTNTFRGYTEHEVITKCDVAVGCRNFGIVFKDYDNKES